MINIKIDSRKIQPGDTFVAIPGATVDGHDYIEKAIVAGATKVVVEKDVECSVDKLLVDNTNEWLTNHIADTYSSTINEMNIIGITGTNGKTTTAYLTYQMLNKLGSKTAYIGTIGFYLPDEDFIELPNTTPNILDLYESVCKRIRNSIITIFFCYLLFSHFFFHFLTFVLFERFNSFFIISSNWQFCEYRL